MPTITVTDITPPHIFKRGDRVKIGRLDRLWLGTYINKWSRKLENETGTVEAYRDTKSYNLLITLDSGKNIWVNENEVILQNALPLAPEAS